MNQYWIEVKNRDKILIPRISVTESEYNFIRENMVYYYSDDIIRKIEKESNNKNICYEYLKKDVNGLEFQLIKSEEVTIEIKKSENFSGYKIKLSTFIQSKEHLAIHCTNLDDTITILKAFWRMGDSTRASESEIKAIYYSSEYTGNFCYTNLGVIIPLKDESCKDWGIKHVYKAEEVDLEN